MGNEYLLNMSQCNAIIISIVLIRTCVCKKMKSEIHPAINRDLVVVIIGKLRQSLEL